MKTKVLYLALAIFLFSGVSVVAQERGGGMGGQDFQARQKEQMEALKKELKLDKDQIKKFDDIYKTSSDKMTKMRENAGDDRTGMREKMTEINTEREGSIKKMLKPDQVKIYDAYLKKQAEARANRGGGGGGGR